MDLNHYEDALQYVQERCAALQGKEPRRYPHLTESLVLRAFFDWCGINGYEIVPSQPPA